MKANLQSEILTPERIRGYIKPIFGFALNRVKQRAEAEDLAQEILLQLIKSAASDASIHNFEAYVWTVARYTWVNWLKKRAHAPRTVEVNGMAELLQDREPEPLEQLIETEAYQTLRREISFLSDIHRRIVVLHYYDGLKQLEIANILGIPAGTVKWHLSDARKELKKGMNRMRKNGILSVNPIRLTGTGHSGTPGKMGETSDFLGRSLAQNVVYAAYHQALTVHEVAQELSMPPALLEGEIQHLTDYGFLIERSPGKYQSNTIIWDSSAEHMEVSHRHYQRCAAQIADAHFDALMEIQKQVEDSGIYYPDQDYNFLLWTLLAKNIEEQARCYQPEGLSFEAVAPIRKDGSRYIAYALLETLNPPVVSYDPQHYYICGTMHRYQEGSPLYLWQLNTFWSQRQDWRFLDFQDVEICSRFWTNVLSDDEQHREDYAFLLEKGYIVKQDGDYQFNTVWIDSPDTLSRLNQAMPDLSGLYKPAISELYRSLLDVSLQNQPKHLERQISHMTLGNSCGGTLTAYVFKHLVDRGKLQAPKPHQAKTVTTWMGPVRS
ncbi:RNA polymerase sigma factor [Paenibacillus sp. GCM10012307]|uniref:Sigma-70 family RNA polymerase sigma factor n=1 Tax=Paenibacillus roseus TaxID=2798579 RepID=A0A934JC00_9BACL|nr:sigma-70 family RNA polymerase sigma factor [Paenibacillus roseus]MBJ6364018.1 sigma-70 family RNA polymerase sigma factor [Paenibacillus roseus]